MAPEYATWDRGVAFPGFRVWQDLLPAWVLMPGLQKIMFNAWQNNGRRQADDAWWTGKADNAAKAKTAKGKAAAAKAGPAQ